MKKVDEKELELAAGGAVGFVVDSAQEGWTLRESYDAPGCTGYEPAFVAASLQYSPSLNPNCSSCRHSATLRVPNATGVDALKGPMYCKKGL